MAHSRIVAGGMLRTNTPYEDYTEEFGLWVKREDKACIKPGPPFSKTRGVYAHVLSRKENVIGVLDTYHSQAGHAVAMACKVLGKKCVNYYPNFKHEPGPRQPQLEAEKLGAELVPLQAGRSAILYHQAKKLTHEQGGYMMPNALKLEESVIETAKECAGNFQTVVIPASSGTIASGVVRGFGDTPTYIIHLGYSRSHSEVESYIKSKSGFNRCKLILIDEKYAYKDKARPGETPPWPCNEYYDLKAFRWWLEVGIRSNHNGPTLFWNVG